MSAQLSWQTACELGFRGQSGRMGAVDGCGGEAISLTRRKKPHFSGSAVWEIHPVMKKAVNGPSLLCRIGPVAFFMKPLNDEKFIAAVRDALNQSLSRK
jgi:hypothetical protein